MSAEETIPELISNRVRKYKSKLLFQRRDGWSWKQITWQDFEKDVRYVAAFLMDFGFGSGDVALLISPNRLESISSEVAVYLLGGMTVPVGKDASPEKIYSLSAESNPKFVFVSDGDALKEIPKIFDKVTSLKRAVVFSDTRLFEEDERVINYKSLLKFGMMKRRKLDDEITEASKKVSPDQAAKIFYFSGYESPGCQQELTQGELVRTLSNVSDDLKFLDGEDQCYSYLPSPSPFENVINYVGIYKGVRIAMAESREDFYSDVLEVMPTILFETKLGLEELYSKFLNGVEKPSFLERKILNKPSPGEKLKTSLGGKIKYVFTDSLPSRETNKAFGEAGISIIEISELNNLETLSS